MIKANIYEYKKREYISKIIIVNDAIQKPQVTTHCLVITFNEIKEWIKQGTIVKHLFRYQEALVLTPMFGVLSRPFLAALLIRLLSRGSCYFEDRQGQRQMITLSVLVRLLCRLMREFGAKFRLMSQIRKEVRQLFSECGFQPSLTLPVDLSARPVYLRTDLWFGVYAGGSVGHIAGVLNHLDEFSGKPVFLTTDIIPTVRDDIETYLILPENSYWDFRQLPELSFNKVFEQKKRACLGGKRLAMIYQRYSCGNFSGVKLAKAYGIPFILEYNGSEIWIARYWGKPLKYEPLLELIELLNLKAADMIVVVSQAMKDELVGRGIEEDKILVNPNGVEPDRFKPETDGSKIRRRYGLDGKTVIGFIGTFGRWHGAEVLAKAIRLVVETNPQVHFLFVGDGLMMPEVKWIVVEDIVSEYVTFTGLVPQEDSPEYLAACDILASPHVPNADGSPFFGSPTKLFEYMAMGKAIVASKLDQIGQILEHNRTGWLVEPGNVDSLANGLNYLINNPDLCLRLSKNARKEVVAKYTWQAHTRRIIERLKEIHNVR